MAEVSGGDMPESHNNRDDDLLDIVDDTEPPGPGVEGGPQPWRILIVDDDADVHRATELAMQGLLIERRPCSFLHARSAGEARQVLAHEDDIAVVLLDVVMETEDAGLKLVHHIRNDLRNETIRIVLRTGQPGYAPEIETVQAYDINDYKTKSELTRTRLYTVLTAAIRSYRQLCALEASRRGLEMIVESSASLSRIRGITRFAEGVVTQICALLGILPEGLVCAQLDGESDVRIVAAAGQFASLIDRPISAIRIDAVRERLLRCLELKTSLYDAGTCLYFGMGEGRAMAALVDAHRELDELDHQLLRAFCSNIAVGFENVVLYSQLLDQAYNDQLLHLPNRTRFAELLDRNLKDPHGVTLALIDIDDFSDINDAFGHAFGDQVLRAVAMRLVEVMGLSTAMARVGADIFGVLGVQSKVNPETVTAAFDEPIVVSGERLQLSATTGLVRLGESQSVGSELLLDAQIALKRAKQAHRGASQYFSDAMGTDARERFKLLKGLRMSFEENRLFLAYQPQVDLATGRCIGAEALLRWRDEHGKFIPPDQFIPLAEQSGLIVHIGEFVLRTACFELRRIIDAGHADFRMAVNISLAQFRHANFLNSVQSAMRDSGVPAANLELEITESIAMEDPSFILRVLEEVKQPGVTVAIDDFGTGFSSLSQLRRLKVDRLKIDRAFVQEAQASEAGATIAMMVVNLGRSLGLTVIAEGIETEEQRQHLLNLGCHEGQGWLFARPQAAEQLEEWLRQEGARAAASKAEQASVS